MINDVRFFAALTILICYFCESPRCYLFIMVISLFVWLFVMIVVMSTLYHAQRQINKKLTLTTVHFESLSRHPNTETDMHIYFINGIVFVLLLSVHKFCCVACL